ncbi:DUF4388 domain-containing protein [bacterium]|nr:DUF4388 domain-containing protein [bacterium]
MKLNGKLEDTGLLNLLMIIKMQLKTGFLELARGNEDNAILYFEDGEIVNATYGTVEGVEAVYILINWNTGSYQFTDHLIPSKLKITSGSKGVYKEGMRRYFVFSILNKINIKPGGKNEGSDLNN